MKRYLSIFLAFVLVFNFTFLSFSYADVIDDLKGVELGDDPTFASPIEIEPVDVDSVKNSTQFSWGGILGTIIGLFIGIFDIISPILLTLIFVFPTIDGCIFNTQDTFRLSFFEGNTSGLSGSIQGSISAIYNAFRYLVTAAYIVTLVYLAIRMMLSSVGRQKAKYKELFKHWFIGLLLLFSFHWVMAFIIWLSNTFVEIFAKLAANILGGTSASTFSFTTLVNAVAPTAISNNPITGFVASRITATTGGGLAALLGRVKPIVGPILSVLLIISAFSIIMTYFKRLFTIAILILTFPLVALSYVFDKIGDRKAQTLSIWLKEFIVNVMIQPIHAIILVFIALIFSTGNTPSDSIAGDLLFNGGLFGPHLIGAIMSLAALRLIPVGEDLLKKLFQINASMGPGAGGIAGSMAKAGMAINGMKNIKDGLKKSGTALSAFNKRRKFGEELYEKANGGKKGSRKEVKDFLESNKDAKKRFDAYTNDMCDRLGVKSLGAAKTLAGSQFLGISAGVGTAITGAGSGRFLTEAGSRAAMYSDFVSSSLSGLLKSPPKEAKDYEARAKEFSKLTDKQVDGLSKDEKKQIAAELGIHWKQVTGDNRNRISKAYSAMAMGAKFGMSKDALKELNPFHVEQENIKKGKMPDGSGDFDITKFDKISQTRDATFGVKDGIKYKISNKGNRHADEDDEISIPNEAIGKSVKSLEAHKKKPEYIRLENELATKRAEHSRAVTAFDDLESEKTKATDEYKAVSKSHRDAHEKINNARNASEVADERARQADTALTAAIEAHGINSTEAKTAQSRYDTAVESAKNAQTALNTAINSAEPIDQNFNAAEARLRTTSQQHAEASRTVSRLSSEEKHIQSELTNLDEKAQKQAYAFEKGVMDLGGDAMFTETAVQIAMDDTHIGSSTFSRDSDGIHVSLSDPSDLSKSPKKYTMSDTGGDPPFTISAADIGADAFATAQEEFASGAPGTADTRLKNIQTIQDSLNDYSFSTIVPDEVESAFSYGDCSELDDFINGAGTKDWLGNKFTIRINKTDNMLFCSICTVKGKIVDGEPTKINLSGYHHFNCDSLKDDTCSITLVPDKNMKGELVWFVKK